MKLERLIVMMPHRSLWEEKNLFH